MDVIFQNGYVELLRLLSENGVPDTRFEPLSQIQGIITTLPEIISDARGQYSCPERCLVYRANLFDAPLQVMSFVK